MNGTPGWFTAKAIYDSAFAVGGVANDARDASRWAMSRGVTGVRKAPLDNVVPIDARCYLGGDPELYSATSGTGLTPDSVITDVPGSHEMGWWLKRRTGAHPLANAVRSDAEYLIPLGKNPNFKGVIFVEGDVAISGRLRGRASIFATGSIILADDLLYHTAPGTSCDAEGDIFGAIATRDVVISDNNVQTPFRINNIMFGGYDDTPRDEQYNLFFLAAGNGSAGSGNFYTSGLPQLGTPGPTPPYLMDGTKNATATAELCSGGPAGCIRITGGLAQGRVDHYTYQPNYGYAEAHTYDKCGQVNPPPYFPTTGRFIESRYYEIDPVWLNNKTIPTYFTELRAQ
jgi:hypothetical protein